MINIIKMIASNVATSIWEGVRDIFNTASGALVAVVVAIILSVIPTSLLILAALVIFAGIVFSKYKETLDNDSE